MPFLCRIVLGIFELSSLDEVSGPISRFRSIDIKVRIGFAMRRRFQHRNERFLQHLGESVRIHRIDQLLSQEQLGTRCGMHRTYITDIENGYRNLSLLTVLKLAQALEIAISSLILRAENGNK